jgi:hypothetical protein
MISPREIHFSQYEKLVSWIAYNTFKFHVFSINEYINLINFKSLHYFNFYLKKNVDMKFSTHDAFLKYN